MSLFTNTISFVLFLVGAYFGNEYLKTSNTDVCYFEEFSVKNDKSYYNPLAYVTSTQFNLPGLLPYFVSLPRNELELTKVFDCAFRNQLKVSIKGGGHSYAGFSQAPVGGFMINMQNFKGVQKIEFKNGTQTLPALRFGSGNRFQDLYEYLNTTQGPKYIISAGLCPTVGVAGYYLGGGIGPLNRALGYGVDQVLEFKVLTMNRTIVIANQDQNSDLFWALRGGGGPSFGVVIEITIKLHPASNIYSYGMICSGYDKVNNKINYTKVEENLNRLGIQEKQFPDWFNLDWRLTQNGLCYLVYSLRGANTTEKILEPLFIPGEYKDVKKKATHPYSMIAQLRYRYIHQWDFMEEFDNLFSMELENARVKQYAEYNNDPDYTQSVVLPGLNPEMIKVLIKNYQNLPSACIIQGMVMGGSVSSSIASNEMAFPYRENVIYASDCGCGYTDETSEYQVKSFALSYIQSVDKWKKGWYLNFPNPQSDNYAVNYWGSNLNQLKQIRKKWNPYRVYPTSFSQEVPLE